MKKDLFCVVALMTFLFVSVIAEKIPNFFRFDLSKVSSLTFSNPSHVFVRADGYGSVVILDTLYPDTLYVTNEKNLRIEKIPLPFSDNVLILGIDIFKTRLVFFINTPSSSKYYAVLYDYKRQKIMDIVGFDNYIEDPEFSPNGRGIAFFRATSQTNEELVILNLSTNEERIVNKEAIGPFTTESEIAWSRNGNICFAVRHPTEGITYDNMGFAVGLSNKLDQGLREYYSNEKRNWKNFSFPFFLTKDVIVFLDGSTSTLVFFDIHSGNITSTDELHLKSEDILYVGYADGKILVVTMRK